MKSRKNYFTKDKVEKRVKEKIEKYRDAFNDPKVRASIDALPKNAETLAIIEKELETVVARLPQKTSRERWIAWSAGIELLQGSNNAKNKMILAEAEKDIEIKEDEKEAG